jgi:hypothetical protein
MRTLKVDEVLEYSNGQIATVFHACGEYDGAQIAVITDGDKFAAIAWYSDDEWCFIDEATPWKSCADAERDIDANVL